MACDTDEHIPDDIIVPDDKKIDMDKVPSQCIDAGICLDLVECGTPDALAACNCVSNLNECRSNPGCRGIGTCDYECSREAGTCTYKACATSPACKVQEGECVAEELDDDGDWDGDGIPNGIEKYTPGLDPCNPDSDGDTIPDGLEDLNRNGKYEPELGETDPTDPNSKPDPEFIETRAAVCTLDKMEGDSLNFATSVVAKFDDVEYAQHQNQVITFDTKEGLHGAFMQGRAYEGKTLLASTILDLVSSFVEESSFNANVPLDAWSDSGIYEKPHQVVPDHLVQRLKYALFLNEGQDLEGVRDAIAAVFKTTIRPAKTSTKCKAVDGVTKARLYLARSIHSDERVIYSFALACEETAARNSVVAIQMDDVLTGTMVAPDNFKPFDRFICQSKSFGDASGMIDFIWIVDNSGSMADELEGLSKTATLFQDRLKQSGVDFRVGLAHTDSYVIEESPDIPEFDSSNNLRPYVLNGAYPAKVGGQWGKIGDEYVYQAVVDGQLDPDAPLYYLEKLYVDVMGLRQLMGRGMERDLRSFANTIKAYQGCIKNNQNGYNICGYGIEDGFRSGVLVLERLSTPSEDKKMWCYQYTQAGATQCAENPESPACALMTGQHYCMNEANHDTPRCKARMAACELREDALKYIIFVSDEESRQFKERQQIISGIKWGIQHPGDRTLRTCATGFKLKGEGSSESPYAMYKGALPLDATVEICNPIITDHYETAEKQSFRINESTTLADVKEQAPEYYRMLDYYMREFQKYAGTGGVAAFALVGDLKELDGYCEPLGDDPAATEGSDYGLSYIHAARFLSYDDGKGKEGGYASICNTNYEQVVSSILEDAIGRVASHPLKGYPISSTIRVAVKCPNMEAKELIRGAKQDGWNYDASQNAIVFSNLYEQVQDKSACSISIAFVIWTVNVG